MLEDLKPEDLKKFCTRLVDRRKEPRVRRNRVEGKDFLDVADVLVSTFTEQGALAVADEVLKDIGCSNDAENLGKHLYFIWFDAEQGKNEESGVRLQNLEPLMSACISISDN